MEKPSWSVNLWGSHPDSNNDDCMTGDDFASEAAARECIANLWTHFNASYYRSCIAFIELDGPTVNEVVSNPAYRRPKPERDDEWRHEIAMQAGMAFGVDGYNDAMEWSANARAIAANKEVVP